MENDMHDWLLPLLSTGCVSLIGAVAWVLHVFPPGLGGEFVHMAFVVVSSVLGVVVGHFVKKWLNKRDEPARLIGKDDAK